MKLLLALDSRPTNRAAFGILDPVRGEWSHFEPVAIEEPFQRRGFRGCCLIAGDLWVVNSAGLYVFRVELGEAPQFVRKMSVRRPEWEEGGRAAADLHHVHYSSARQQVFVANSFMDAVDVFDLTGEFVRRHWLRDLCPDVGRAGDSRSKSAPDLVHLNHISENGGRLYLTLGNWNGTRIGRVICFDTGETILDSLAFPHDGFVVDGDFYISESGANRVLVFENVGEPLDLRQRHPDRTLEVSVQQSAWKGSFQWVRGIAVTRRHIICGVSQWRKGSEAQQQIPPRLVFFDRATGTHEGDLFLPDVDGFASPSIFSIHVIDAEEDEIGPGGWSVPERDSRAERSLTPLCEVGYQDPARPGALSSGWGLGRDWPGRVLVEKDGALSIAFDVPAGSQRYVQTARGAFSTPPVESPFDAIPGQDYVLHIDLEVHSGDPTVQLWLIEYSDSERLTHTTTWLASGSNDLNFTATKQTRSVRLAFRCAAKGAVLLSPVRVHTVVREPTD